MSTEQEIKQQVMGMAVSEIETLLNIIGDMGYIGYKISMCKLKGNSYQSCANKLKISKSLAQHYYKKCIEKQYDLHLKRIFNIK